MMDNGSLELRLQVRRELKEEQDRYILAITGENNPEEIQQIRQRILTLQEEIAKLSARKGYTGL